MTPWTVVGFIGGARTMAALHGEPLGEVKLNQLENGQLAAAGAALRSRVEALRRISADGQRLLARLLGGDLGRCCRVLIRLTGAPRPPGATRYSTRQILEPEERHAHAGRYLAVMDCIRPAAGLRASMAVLFSRRAGSPCRHHVVT